MTGMFIDYIIIKFYSTGTPQEIACEILNHPRVSLLDNNGYLNPDGWNDGADAKSNIRDTCNGGRAKRSR